MFSVRKSIMLACLTRPSEENELMDKPNTLNNKKLQISLFFN